MLNTQKNSRELHSQPVLLILPPETAENDEEQVYNVEVELHCTQYVLFWAHWVLPVLAAHNSLRVKHQKL